MVFDSSFYAIFWCNKIDLRKFRGVCILKGKAARTTHIHIYHDICHPPRTKISLLLDVVSSQSCRHACLQNVFASLLFFNKRVLSGNVRLAIIYHNLSTDLFVDIVDGAGMDAT